MSLARVIAAALAASIVAPQQTGASRTALAIVSDANADDVRRRSTDAGGTARRAGSQPDLQKRAVTGRRAWRRDDSVRRPAVRRAHLAVGDATRREPRRARPDDRADRRQPRRAA